MLNYLFLFVWYCGPKCKGCRHQRCINEYENSDRGRADEKSPYCLVCERPACSFCGKGYDGKRAFAVSSGKPYICDNKTCKSKQRKEQGRWISDAWILLWMEHFSRLAGTFGCKSLDDCSSCHNTLVEHFNLYEEGTDQRVSLWSFAWQADFVVTLFNLYDQSDSSGDKIMYGKLSSLQDCMPTNQSCRHEKCWYVWMLWCLTLGKDEMRNR